MLVLDHRYDRLLPPRRLRQQHDKHFVDLSVLLLLLLGVKADDRSLERDHAVHLLRDMVVDMTDTRMMMCNRMDRDIMIALYHVKMGHAMVVNTATGTIHQFGMRPTFSATIHIHSTMTFPFPTRLLSPLHMTNSCMMES